jgi:hypothetical protein
MTLLMIFDNRPEADNERILSWCPRKEKSEGHGGEPGEF